MVSAVWDPGRNWKVRAEGGKDASKSSLRLQSKERARGHKKTRSIRRLKDKDENLTTNIMDPGVIRNDEATDGRNGGIDDRRTSN